MEEQLIQQINKDVSKNTTCECYYLRKYFGREPIEAYSTLRMMETFQDGLIAPGIKDRELLDVLLYRNKSNRESVELINKLKTLVND